MSVMRFGAKMACKRGWYNPSQHPIAELAAEHAEQIQTLFVDYFVSGCFIRFPDSGLKQNRWLYRICGLMLECFPMRSGEIAIDLPQLGCAHQDDNGDDQSFVFET